MLLHHKAAEDRVRVNAVFSRCLTEAAPFTATATFDCDSPHPVRFRWSSPCFTWRMSHRDDFLAWVNSQLRDADIAVYNGDATARRAIWSQTEPVTLFGALKSAVGRTEVDEVFGFLERYFSDSKSYTFCLLYTSPSPRDRS